MYTQIHTYIYTHIHIHYTHTHKYIHITYKSVLLQRFLELWVESEVAGFFVF